MKYNIKIHILDHATYYVNELKGSDKYYTHFNTSVCTTCFIREGIITQEDIDENMMIILKNIEQKKIIVREKNGTYTKKNGKIVQRYRTRTIDFKNMLSAYHSRHFDSSKSVNPHFHFLFSKKARLGKDFIYLKQALREEANKYKIKFNFMEEKQNTGLSKKQLSRIESLSWLLNQGNTTKVKRYLSNNKELTKILDFLQIHYQNTQNISYFLKILSILNQRLQEFDIDFTYKNINLKKSIYFFLTNTQKNMLISLENGRTVEIKLSNVLEKELLKKAHGFSSDIIDVISKKFNLSNLSPKQLRYAKKDDKNDSNAIKKNSFSKLLRQDLRDSLAYAKSEKDWKNILLRMGYKKVSINSSKSLGKRVKTAITLTTKKKTKMQIPFHTMHLSFKKITKIMIHNKKRNRKKKNYDNNFDNYQKRKKRQYKIWQKYTVQMKLLLQIYSNSKSKNIINEKVLKNLANTYTIYTSDMYKITTYQTVSTTIIDNDTAITLKKLEGDMANSIRDMLDITILKGWDLTLLIIKGTPDFVYETINQIKRRLEPNRIEQKTLQRNNSTHLKI